MSKNIKFPLFTFCFAILSKLLGEFGLIVKSSITIIITCFLIDLFLVVPFPNDHWDISCFGGIQDNEYFGYRQSGLLELNNLELFNSL